ncbi:sigma-54-dependent Fis family transcriptional regulator [Methyloprofundus sp.]|uniref:sigma-54-dependent Fis family transcriptional regulator n=1 Tax=Methyloprofundus sp. TaxID=2020875 RepID=UPI003D13E3CF
MVCAAEKKSIIPAGESIEPAPSHWFDSQFGTLLSIPSTHRDLNKMVPEGNFREDLYYRFSVFPLTLPPLRERQQDISVLAQWFTNKYAQKMGKPITQIPQAVIDNLLNYNWPGNIRELENVIERAVILSSSHILQIPVLKKRAENMIGDDQPVLTLAEMEKAYIIKILEGTGWQISGEQGAASILEMHPNTLRSRMSKLGIRRASTSG